MNVVVIADPIYDYNRAAIQGAADFVRQRGWRFQIGDISDHAGLRRAVADADALLLGVHRWESDPLLARTTLPAVGWSATLEETSWPRVLPDDRAVGRLVAEHFLARGHRNLAFLSDVVFKWAARRRDGFVTCATAAGAKPIVPRPSDVRSAPQLRRWVAKLPIPCAVMAVHDSTAARLYAACSVAGRRIPDEVAIVGVNDDPLICQTLEPQLSTVALQKYRIGYEAGQLLASLLRGGQTISWMTLVPPLELVVRGSSGVSASSDALVIAALRWIAEQLTTGIGTKQVMRKLGVSRTTLDGRFRAALGRTVAAEIRRLRLEAAMRLLRSTAEAMPMIAEQTGFSSARQLTETFHHVVGETPTSYRRRFQGRLNDGARVQNGPP